MEQSDRLEEGVRRGDAATVYAAVEAAAQRLTRSDLPPNSDAGISVACGSRREIEASGGGERASAMAMIQGEEVRALWRVVWVGVGLFERDRRYRQVENPYVSSVTSRRVGSVSNRLLLPACWPSWSLLGDH